jgi:hypothetical protein
MPHRGELVCMSLLFFREYFHLHRNYEQIWCICQFDSHCFEKTCWISGE